MPRMTLERVKRMEIQNEDVPERVYKAESVLNGDGRKISSPAIRERIYHIAIQRMTDRILKSFEYLSEVEIFTRQRPAYTFRICSIECFEINGKILPEFITCPHHYITLINRLSGNLSLDYIILFYQ